MPSICQHDGCGKIFKCNQNRDKHFRNVHLGDIQENPCPECNRNFRAENLARHVVQAHSHPNEPMQCGNCFAFLPTADSLQKHCDRVHGGVSLKRKSTVQEGGASVSTKPMKRLKLHDLDIPFEIRNSDTDVGQIYRDNWSKIKTHVHRRKFQQTYNFRIDGILEPEPIMAHIFSEQEYIFKANISAGFILRNRVSEELRYYYACANNAKVFDKPFIIRDRASLEVATEGIADFLENSYEYAYKQKPSSSWFVEAVTNVSFIINPLPNHPIGSTPVILPDYVIRNRGLHPLVATSNGPITDRLCVFRCIALHNGAPDHRNIETETLALFKMLHAADDPLDFEGVKLSDLTRIEEHFGLGIDVYELVHYDNEVSAKLKRRPLKKHNSTMKVCMVEKHFSFIHNMAKFASSFCCSRCDQIMTSQKKCTRHEKTCTGGQKTHYQGGIYRIQRTIFEELADEGIFVEPGDRLYPYRITYDLETYFRKEKEHSTSGNLQVTATHMPLSASVCSNVPGFTEPKCFVADSEGESHKVVTDMVGYMEDISTASSNILRAKFAMILNKEESANKYTKKLIKRFREHLDQCPAIGFCSSRYDINVCKTILLPHLARYSKIKFAIKKCNAFLMIATPTLRFLDISAYLAPGWSYSMFLAAFQCTEKKSHFPFSYVDSPEKLKEKGLPPRSAFFDVLQNKEMPETDYAELAAEWKALKLTDLKSLLVHYNNRDTFPFGLALEKYCKIYAAQGFDPFKDAISVPGLANRELFADIEQHFYLFNERDRDLYDKVKSNLVGGQSEIFHRYHEAGVTKIRGGDNTVQKIVGYDSNGLYMGCTTMHDMPCGMYCRRDANRGFRPKWPRVYGRQARTWMEWVAKTEGVSIRTQYNNTEKLLTKMEKPVRADGWIAQKNTVLQYHGCHWHGHQNCRINERDIERRLDDDERATFSAMLLTRYNDTVETSEKIRQAGYLLREKWECEWEDDKSANDDIQTHCDSFKTPMELKYGKRGMKENQIIEAIKSGDLFGIVECDISVPDDWPSAQIPLNLHTNLSPREYFAELPPIFKNATVPFSEIGETMQSFVSNNHLSDKPRRMLVSSFFGKQQMFITEMLIWLLEHGLVIEKIYTVIEYERAKPFVCKGNSISDARRAGDLDPSLKIISDMRKLTGNSFYGKPITDQASQLMVSYLDDKAAGEALNGGFFQSLSTLDEGDKDESGIHEVTCLKKRVKFNLPISIGFYTYQLAKLRVLKFLYDCIDRFVPRAKYQLCQMDTDSIYTAIAGASIFDVLKAEHLREFYESYNEWFPARACDTHAGDWMDTMMSGGTWQPNKCCAARAAYDQRTPELFKLEWEGHGFVGLCSKTYYCWSNDGGNDKFAAKGVNKKRNVIDKNSYLNVLRSQKTCRVENSGFRLLNDQMKTYVQKKDGMTFNYWKRVVQPDGVSTKALNI